jgi:hypothetical protein
VAVESFLAHSFEVSHIACTQIPCRKFFINTQVDEGERHPRYVPDKYESRIRTSADVRMGQHTPDNRLPSSFGRCADTVVDGHYENRNLSRLSVS